MASQRQFTAIKGNTKVSVSGPYKELFEFTLRKAFPEIVKTLESTVSKIKDDAQKEWPVRQFKSKRSVDEFEITFALTNDGIKVSLDNNAPYAAGILSGKVFPSHNQTGQITSVPPNHLVWWNLLYRPAMNATDKVLKELSDELMSELKRAN